MMFAMDIGLNIYIFSKITVTMNNRICWTDVHGDVSWRCVNYYDLPLAALLINRSTIIETWQRVA